MSKLRKSFPYQETDSEMKSKTKRKINLKYELDKPLPDINLDDYDIEMHSEDEIMQSGNSSNDDDEDDDIPSKIMKSSSSPLWVLPLFSMLPAHKQSEVNHFYFNYTLKKFTKTIIYFRYLNHLLQVAECVLLVLM